jgi:hypothetical protein
VWRLTDLKSTRLLYSRMLLNEMTLAYAFVETMEGFSSIVASKDGSDRNISTANRGNGGGDDSLDTAYIPAEEWKKLSPEKRKHIQSEQEKKKRNSRRRTR